MTANRELAKKQGLSEDDIIAINTVHQRMEAFLKRPGMYANPKDCPDVVTAFETVLQALWYFPLDKKFHRYQFELNGCTCPCLDNAERVGYTETRIVNKNCPYHGKET